MDEVEFAISTKKVNRFGAGMDKRLHKPSGAWPLALGQRSELSAVAWWQSDIYRKAYFDIPTPL